MEPGEVLAIVGATGAGKSTIINLIGRFYDIQKGSITIDGIDVRDFQQTDLRRRLGYVFKIPSSLPARSKRISVCIIQT